MKVAVFIDVQNDFVHGGALPYAYPARDIVPEIIRFAESRRAAGYALYATADTHKQTIYDGYDDASARKPVCGYLTTLEGRKLPVSHCIEGTVGHKIVDGLVKDAARNVIIPQGHIFDKPTFGSFGLADGIYADFHGGDRRATYQGEPIEKIEICGFCTSICVVSNALLLRARFPDVPIEVMENLCGDVSREGHEAALAVMRNCQIDIMKIFV